MLQRECNTAESVQRQRCNVFFCVQGRNVAHTISICMKRSALYWSASWFTWRAAIWNVDDFTAFRERKWSYCSADLWCLSWGVSWWFYPLRSFVHASRRESNLIWSHTFDTFWVPPQDPWSIYRFDTIWCILHWNHQSWCKNVVCVRWFWLKPWPPSLCVKMAASQRRNCRHRKKPNKLQFLAYKTLEKHVGNCGQIAGASHFCSLLVFFCCFARSLVSMLPGCSFCLLWTLWGSV